jgi:hypothetical protein
MIYSAKFAAIKANARAEKASEAKATPVAVAA